MNEIAWRRRVRPDSRNTVDRVVRCPEQVRRTPPGASDLLHVRASVQLAFHLAGQVEAGLDDVPRSARGAGEQTVQPDPDRGDHAKEAHE